MILKWKDAIESLNSFDKINATLTRNQRLKLVNELSQLESFLEDLERETRTPPTATKKLKGEK